ncbi:MAG: hypothetical protein AVDCRST_MAG68-3848 [uncultured Gemmatimonadetes bacterium]|uniref:Uncharacterized protein n=1 Tax=uncultured Gemmatimonadota bacterium TaxID=203437 RepID=A0A6J4MA61_9BACT|nr:MAG: hypothetical protein AVDCRST_MAG68-3848 [uncultured Gemmatimonadota bacterium]
MPRISASASSLVNWRLIVPHRVSGVKQKFEAVDLSTREREIAPLAPGRPAHLLKTLEG